MFAVAGAYLIPRHHTSQEHTSFLINSPPPTLEPHRGNLKLPKLSYDQHAGDLSCRRDDFVIPTTAEFLACRGCSAEVFSGPGVVLSL